MFVRRAESLGMPVVDDPESVLKCGNKVYMQELLNRRRIATPRTLIVQRGNVDEIVSTLGRPAVASMRVKGQSRRLRVLRAAHVATAAHSLQR